MQIIHDLTEEQKICSCCGLPFELLNREEISYEVTVEVVYRLIKHCRKKYLQTCCCTREMIVTAPPPQKLFKAGLYSMDFWSKVLLDKYAHGIPLTRQLGMMKQHGLSISKGSLPEGLWKIADLLEPLYKLMFEKIAHEDLVHADETRWHNFAKCYEQDRKSEKTLHWLWGFFSENYRLFVIDPTRGADVLRKHFGQGEAYTIEPIFVTDRYAAYLSACGLIAFCWAHVRRDFLGLQIKYPNDSILYEWCQQWLDLIKDLYRINRLRLANVNQSECFEGYQKQLENLTHKMETIQNKTYRHPLMAKQTTSMRKHWDGLTLFVNFHEIPMDNNLAERELRGPVIGRKSFYGTHSDRATRSTAILYSIIATAKKHKCNLQHYFKDYLTVCAKNRKPPPKKILKTFLPHLYAKKHPDSLI